MQRTFLFFLGTGPCPVHLYSLVCAAALESVNVVLIDALVNRSSICLADRAAKLKHVGRASHSSGFSFYNVLVFSVYLCEQGVRTAWLVNGDALLFNKSLCKSVLLKAFGAKWLAVPAVASALAAVSAGGLCVNSKFSNQVVFTCSVRFVVVKADADTLILHMSRLEI